jgi:signal transduction histidine kinase
MQRGENEMMPIHLDSGLNELIQIEDALNDLIARLDRTVRRERNFIANAAHELRTPLAAVRAQAEAIDMQGISPQVSGQINGVLEATDRATRLISQLLQLARSESATPVNADGNSIDLVAIARDLISQITPEIFEVRGDIELIAPASARVPGNAELIHAMLRNLLENAVKYAGKPIRISVTVEAGGEDGPSICVEDNGPGLSELDFQAALVKFERLGRKSGGGAGLGLSIVQEIVERLNLRIAMASAGRLGGLKVTVLFHRIASP